MTEFQELNTKLAMRLSERASLPGAGVDFSGAEIVGMLSDLTGAGIAQQVLNGFLKKGYLRQTKTISDEEERGRFEITPSLIRLAAEIQKIRPARAPKPKFRSFKNALLVALAREEEKNGSDLYDLKQVADAAGLLYSEGWVRKAAYSFRDQGLIIEAFSMGGGSDGNLHASLTAEGLELAEELMENLSLPDASIGNATLGASKLADGSKWDEDEWDKAKWADDIPASDRIVNRSDNAKDYDEAGKLLEQIIEEFYIDHKLDNELGPEKNTILSTLKAGSELWKSGSAKVDAIRTFIIDPLCVLRDRYEQAIAGVLITGMVNKAIEAFNALISKLP